MGATTAEAAKRPISRGLAACELGVATTIPAGLAASFHSKFDRSQQYFSTTLRLN
jgi:hypothetical protein